MADAVPSEKGRPTKEEIQKKIDECEESKKAIENDVILGEEEKAELCQRADKLKVLDLQESEFQTDNEKSQQLATIFSSINDNVSSGEGVVRKLQA